MLVGEHLCNPCNLCKPLQLLPTSLGREVPRKGRREPAVHSSGLGGSGACPRPSCLSPLSGVFPLLRSFSVSLKDRPLRPGIFARVPSRTRLSILKTLKTLKTVSHSNPFNSSTMQPTSATLAPPATSATLQPNPATLQPCNSATSFESRYLALLELLRASGFSLAPLRADAETLRLAAALEERRREYPETSPLGRRRFESFGRKLLRATGRTALLREVAKSHIEAVLAPYKNPCTYNGLRSNARAFFDWCVRRHLLRVSPVADIEPLPEPPKEPCFYTPDRVRRVFAAAMSPDTDPAIGVFLTLGFFCGLRTSEIQRAVAGDVNFADGTVRVPIPKGYYRGAPPRLVQPPENAIAWLRYFLPDNLPSDAPIAATPHALGAWKRTHLEPLGLDWTRDENRNVMRHTACTMHVAAFRNLAETQLLLGHTRGSSITVQHYLGLASQKLGEAYWAILPPKGQGGRHPNARSAPSTKRGISPRDGRFLTIDLDDSGAPIPRGPGRATVGPDGVISFGTDALPPPLAN